MKVICDRGALLEAVNLVAGVVPTRTPTPQLSSIRLIATKGPGGSELTIAGSDAESSLILSIAQVDVAEPGTALVPADKLRQIVSAEEGEPTLTIESQGDRCDIRGANAHFRVFGPAGDYPPIPDFASIVAATGSEAPKTVFSCQAGQLIQIVQRTVFATARETSRYAINGVLLRREGKKLEMVATDGRRLALSRAVVSGAGAGKDAAAVSCIIPTKALGLVPKLVHNDEDQVRIAITESRIFFAFDHPSAGEGKKGGGALRAPRGALLDAR